MVLYFTGTGNSRHIAERIAHALNDTLISLNDRIKSGDITPLAVNGRLVLVMPSFFATSDASPQKNSTFLTPLRAAFSRASSMASGTISAPRTFFA